MSSLLAKSGPSSSELAEIDPDNVVQLDQGSAEFKANAHRQESSISDRDVARLRIQARSPELMGWSGRAPALPVCAGRRVRRRETDRKVSIGNARKMQVDSETNCKALVSRNRKSFRAYLRRRPLSLQQRGRFGALKDVPLAYSVIVSPLHQIDMDMVFMIGICPVAEYGRKP